MKYVGHGDIVVEIVDSELGMGQEIPLCIRFTDIRAAVRFCVRYNRDNTDKVVPEFYSYARLEDSLVMIRTREHGKRVIREWEAERRRERKGG